MKKVLVLFILMTALGTSAFASGVGSTFGTLTTARTLGMGKVDFGAGVGIADATSVFATLTYGASQYMDFRGKVGLHDDNDNLNLSLGADFKWQFMDVKSARRDPLDLSFGGLFEFIDLENGSVLEFGAHAIGSYPFVLHNAGTLSPYARMNIRFETLNYDTKYFPGKDSETDIRFGLNGGAAWEATPAITLYGEFQIDGNDGVFFGANFNIQ